MRKIYSSRGIEQACRENICFMYLLEDNPAPDHNTIARFRSRHLVDCEKELLEQFVAMLVKWGYVSMATVFIDGTKIEANANRYSFVWKKSTEKNLAKLKVQIGKALSGMVTKLGLKWHIPEMIQFHQIKKLRKKLYAKAEAEKLEWVREADPREPQYPGRGRLRHDKGRHALSQIPAPQHGQGRGRVGASESGLQPAQAAS